MQNNDDVAKRRAKRRKKARRKHLIIGFVVFLIFSLLIGLVLSVTVLFPIKQVSAKGSKIYSQEEIITSAKLEGENLFTVSEDDLLKKLQKELPFVDAVKIDRSLPDSVLINVTDAKEDLCYKIEKKYFTTSEKNYVLKEYSKVPKNTVEVITNIKKCKVGEPIEFENENQKSCTEKLRKELSDKNLLINYIDTKDMNAIKVGVENKFKVLLGTDSYLEQKCSHLKGMIDSIDKKQWGTINLTMWTPSKSEGTFIKGSKK